MLFWACEFKSRPGHHVILGAVAKWQGRGLQNLHHRFESGRRLQTPIDAVERLITSHLIPVIRLRGRGSWNAVVRTKSRRNRNDPSARHVRVRTSAGSRVRCTILPISRYPKGPGRGGRADEDYAHCRLVERRSRRLPVPRPASRSREPLGRALDHYSSRSCTAAWPDEHHPLEPFAVSSFRFEMSRTTCSALVRPFAPKESVTSQTTLT